MLGLIVGIPPFGAVVDIGGLALPRETFDFLTKAI
jgi:hypothetical protein